MSRIKSKITTTVTDKGYKKVIESINEVKDKKFVKAGILQKDAGDKDPGDDFTLAQIASVQEFGTVDGRIPERSFIRSAMDENRKALFIATQSQIVKILSGQTTVNKALNLLGVLITSVIKAKITNLRTPANAPSTIRKKGSTNPLIDTGRLRNSINHEVTE